MILENAFILKKDFAQPEIPFRVADLLRFTGVRSFCVFLKLKRAGLRPGHGI